MACLTTVDIYRGAAVWWRNRACRAGGALTAQECLELAHTNELKADAIEQMTAEQHIRLGSPKLRGYWAP